MSPLISKLGLGLRNNWKTVVVVIAAVFLYVKVSAWWDGYQEQKQAYEATVSKLLVERNDFRVEAESAKAALAEKEDHEKRLELLLADALERQDAVRKEAREQQKIFERHDFQKLTEAKPGLIEALANRATQERMDAFEDAFNE